MIKAVYFDLDGVLFNRNEAERVTLNYINKYYLNTINEYELQKKWKNINLDLWSKCCKKKITADDVLIKRWSEIIDRIGLKKNISSEELSEVYIEKYTSPIYKIDITSILKKLKSEKYLLAVITNGVKRIQTLKIKKMELENYFDFIVTDQESGYRKPDVRMFKYALSKHQIEGSEAIYIGDSYTDDIIPSQKLDITPILYGHTPYKNEINSFFYMAENKEKLQTILNKLLE